MAPILTNTAKPRFLAYKCKWSSAW